MSRIDCQDEDGISRNTRIPTGYAPWSGGMTRVAALTGALSLMASASASAQFQLDMTADEVDSHFGVRSVSGLAVNESGYLDSIGARFCAQDGRLFVEGAWELVDLSSLIIHGFSVRRLANETVELDIEPGRLSERPVADALALEFVGSPQACDAVRSLWPDMRLFAVRTVDGHDSLSALIGFHMGSASGGGGETDRSAGRADPAPDWGDDRYPDIDYTSSAFNAGRYGLADIVGHWVVYEDTAEIDDSPRVRARTYAPSTTSDPDRWLLLACVENQTRVVFVVDERLTADPRTHQVTVEFRIDEEPAKSERWNTSTTDRAVGLWGGPSSAMIRSMLGHDSIYIRVTDDRNRRYQERFDIRGVDDVAARVAAACGWSTLSLTHSDYLAVQQSLRRLGFYDGAIDGAWGPLSQAAMRAFQDANGLAVTGVPDKDTLDLLEE